MERESMITGALMDENRCVPERWFNLEGMNN